MPPKVPNLHLASFLKVMAGTAPPRRAIKMKCFECVGFQDLKNMVGNCTATSCPLWQYRPYKNKTPENP